MNLLKEINTELKKIDTEISFKKFFFFGGLLPAMIFFPIFYLLNPVTQEAVTNIVIAIFGVLAFTCMFMILSLYALMGFKVYIVLSPKVSNGLTEKTYLFLTKNKNVQRFLDLFALKIEDKLNPQWNKQSNQIAQNTERLDGQEYKLTELENIVKEQNIEIEEIKKNRKLDMLAYQKLHIMYWQEKCKNMKLEYKQKKEDTKDWLEEYSNTEINEDESEKVNQDNKFKESL